MTRYDRSPNLVTGDLVIAGGGTLLTDHDERWWVGQDFGPDDGAAGYADFVTSHAQAALPAYWRFDQTSPEILKWLWVPGDGWDAYTLRLAWLTPDVSAGNVVWRYSRAFYDFNSALTGAPTVVATLAPVAAPAAVGAAWRYTELATADPITRGGLGESAILSVVERVAGDAGDTANGDVGVWAASATRA